MKEYTTIKLKLHYTPDFKPTCATGVEPNQTCKFMSFRKWGQQPYCEYLHKEVERYSEPRYTKPCCDFHEKE